MEEYKTATGRIMTDAELDALAAEAERGYEFPDGEPNSGMMHWRP